MAEVPHAAARVFSLCSVSQSDAPTRTTPRTTMTVNRGRLLNEGHGRHGEGEQEPDDANLPGSGVNAGARKWRRPAMSSD